MTLTPITNRQTPNDSILDINGRQTYLGNTFILPINGTELFDENEHTLCLINNPINSGKALFLYGRKIASTDVTFVRFYGAPTLMNNGALTSTPNLRPGSSNTSISQCYLSPVVASPVAQVTKLVFSQTGTFYDVVGSAKAVQLFSPTNAPYYFYFTVTGGSNIQTDPLLPGTGVNVVISQGPTATAAQIATEFYTAVAAVSTLFTATNTPAGTVTVTNVSPGTLVSPDAVTGTAAALTVVTPGSNIGVATYLATLATTVLIETDSTLLTILDPGYSLLITAQSSAATSMAPVEVFLENVWYEI